jgi:hypothetical protein
MKIKSFGIILLVVSLTVSMTSCKKKGCVDAYAENFDAEAGKDDGSCTYLSNKLLGTYSVTSDCQYEGMSSYSMNVIEGSNKGEVILQGLDGSFDMKATISGTQFSFGEDKAGITYEGTGYLVGSNQITINMEVCETFFYPCSDPDYCTLTCTK